MALLISQIVMGLSYLVVVYVMFENALLVNYAPHLWLAVTIPFTFTIYTFFFNVGKEGKGPTIYSAFNTIHVIISVFLLLGIAASSITYMVKFSIDATNCAAIRANGFNPITNPNTTSPLVGWAYISPIVCTDPTYGQWVTIACFDVLILILVIWSYFCLFFVFRYGGVWNLLVGRHGWFSDGDVMGDLGNNQWAVQGSDDLFYNEMDRVSGHTGHHHGRTGMQPMQPMGYSKV